VNQYKHICLWIWCFSLTHYRELTIWLPSYGITCSVTKSPLRHSIGTIFFNGSWFVLTSLICEE
jgi:hypothetical protein